MAEPHVITALVAKHAELSGRLSAIGKEAENIKAALVHVAAAIHLFSPAYQIGSIIPRKTHKRRNENFSKGGYIRHAMDVLRDAKEPLSVREIARLALERQGVHNPDNKTLEDIRRGLNGGLMISPQ